MSERNRINPQCRNYGSHRCRKNNYYGKNSFYTGVNHKIGEVHDGEATMDWMAQEQERNHHYISLYNMSLEGI